MKDKILIGLFLLTFLALTVFSMNTAMAVIGNPSEIDRIKFEPGRGLTNGTMMSHNTSLNISIINATPLAENSSIASCSFHLKSADSNAINNTWVTLRNDSTEGSTTFYNQTTPQEGESHNWHVYPGLETGGFNMSQVADGDNYILNVSCIMANGTYSNTTELFLYGWVIDNTNGSNPEQVFPVDNTVDDDGNITFNCTGVSHWNATNCTLYLKGQLGYVTAYNMTYNHSSINQTTTTCVLNLNDVLDGVYEWSIGVSDGLNESNSTWLSLDATIRHMTLKKKELMAREGQIISPVVTTTLAKPLFAGITLGGMIALVVVCGLALWFYLKVIKKRTW